MSRNFLIIANPISGGGRSRERAPELRDALQARGATAELYFTERSGDAGRRAAEIGEGEYDAVVSVGGDGTLNEVLNGLPDPTIPLGILAMGTANVLALELKVPRDPRELAEVLIAGRLQSAAIGLVNDRRFLLFVSSGLDAEIVRRVDEVRTGTLGKLKWTGPILHIIRRWPVESHRVVTDDGAVFDDLTTVVVSRVGTYGGLLGLPGGVHIGDGKLHVFGFRQRSRWAYLRAMIRALAKRLRPGRDVEHIATTGLRIEATGTWQVDGDVGGRGDLCLSLLPTSARLFVP